MSTRIKARWRLQRGEKEEDGSRRQLLNGDGEAVEDASVFWSYPRGRCRGHMRWHVMKARWTAHSDDVG
jgi:hypothetical protein